MNIFSPRRLPVFFAREKELASLTSQINSGRKCAVMIYGKRRVGKTALIQQAARSFDGIFVNHTCVRSSPAINLESLTDDIFRELGIPAPQFRNIRDLFRFLNGIHQKMLICMDEYPYYSTAGKKGELDSEMQEVIDQLSPEIRLILCGSYITVMRDLLSEENPLFGRFTLVLHLHDFDYLDASLFFPAESVHRKAALYAVFGGSPYVLSCINLNKSLEENLEQLLINPDGILRIHVENIMLEEIRNSFDPQIFAIIGNGKCRYSDLLTKLLLDKNTGNLDKQLKTLLSMESIEKVAPINKAGDRKKQFYEISDNLMRFFFTYLYDKGSIISRLGERQFYKTQIEPSLVEFLSRRFEGICRQYFSRRVKCGQLPDVTDIGTYWYDDPATKSNGEFDCVLRDSSDAYNFYECKYYHNPMTLSECRKEAAQTKKLAAQNLKIRLSGFICTAGFAFSPSLLGQSTELISGEMLYDPALFSAL